MSVEKTPSQNLDLQELKIKLGDYFDKASLIESKKSNGIPFGYQWEPTTLHIVEAINLERGNVWGGYTADGTDTVKHASNYKDTLVTGASFDAYCRTFGFGKYGTEIVGKKILDVGAGLSSFGATANYLFAPYGTKVTSFDPIYQDKSLIEKLKTEFGSFIGEEQLMPEQLPEFVAGLSQELPFKDKSFDIAISSFSATLVPTEQFPQVVQEMCRVAKSQVQIAPFIAFEDIEKISVPEGISFVRQSLDSFTMVIDLVNGNVDEAVKWIKDKGYGENNGQFNATPDLLQKRKEGFYYKNEIHRFKNQEPFHFNSSQEVVSNLQIDEEGRIIDTNTAESGKEEEDSQRLRR